MKFLKRVFTPPMFDDELKAQQAYLLHIILWALIFIPLPYVIFIFISSPETLPRALAQAAFGEIANIILLIALRRGHVRSASIVQVSAFWFFFTVTAFTGNGVQGEAYLIGYTLVISVAGILLGGSGALIFTILSLASGVFMVNLQMQGKMEAGFTSSPLATWFISLMLFPIGAILQRLASNRVRLALERATASEERYRLISQISSDYTFSTELDSQGNINLNWVAGAFTEITGYTYDEYVAGGGWLGHLHPDDVEKDARDTAILKTNNPVITEVRTFKKNREVRWVRVYANPVWDEKKNCLVGIVGAVQDITKQKQAEEREEQRRVLLENVILIGKQVTETQNLQVTLARIWHGVHNVLGFDRLTVFLYNAERNSMDSVIGTTISGEMEDTSGIWFPIAEWTTFKLVLDKPDGVFITRNYDEENNIPIGHEMHGVKDYAAVAAWAGDKPVAVICVDQLLTKRRITDHQLEALRLFAGYAGLSIENSRLNEALKRELKLQKQAEENEANRRAMLEKIVLLGQQVTEVKDLKTTLERIWHGVHDYIGFDRLAIFLYDQATNTVNGTLGTDNEGKIVEEWDYKRTLDHEKPTSFMRALERPDGLFYTSDFGVEFEMPEGHEMFEVKDFAAAAAWAGDEPVAIITVDNHPSGRPFTQAQLESLRLFAGYAGLAIENARLHSALEAELEQQKKEEERETRRRKTLEKVVRLGKSVTEVANIRTTIERIWHGVHNELEFDRLGIFLYNEERRSMDGTFGTNNNGDMVDEWDIWYPVTDAAIFMRVLKRPDGMYFTHNYDVENNIPEGDEMYGVKDYAAVAAWAGDKPVAVICVDRLPSGSVITEEQLEALRLFAGYAGLAIENSRLNSAIQNELRQRQDFINELENKNAELERFTYTVSHDLKSPLVTITGFLGYLEKDATNGRLDRVNNSIKRISSAAKKMQALLNDLLELSRIGRIMNAPENIPFDEIVNEAIDHVRGRLDEVNAIVEIQRDFPVVYGDRVRLVEVVQNLVENAVKYSNPHSRLRVEIGMDGHNERGCPIFHVRDNGIGIEPQYHERIFGLFNKLDAQSEGTGIGLSLVKRIIEVHNGRIWVESQIGKGATFYFSLPAPQTKE